MNKDIRVDNVENEMSKSCDRSLRRHFSLSRGSTFQRLSVMTNTSTGPLPAQIECVRGIPVMVMMGRLDTTNAPLFDAQAASFLAEARRRVLLDLSGLTYISSAGLRSIIRIIKHTAVCGGRTGIFAVPAHILELIEISGFQPLIDIYPDHETALNGTSA
jgi:anti-anti-sigma factor